MRGEIKENETQKIIESNSDRRTRGAGEGHKQEGEQRQGQPLPIPIFMDLAAKKTTMKLRASFQKIHTGMCSRGERKEIKT